jgi:hypothetical protein
LSAYARFEDVSASSQLVFMIRVVLRIAKIHKIEIHSFDVSAATNLGLGAESGWESHQKDA